MAVAGGEELSSILAVRPGKTGGEIVVSAHYDTVPGSPGALDDAAGVAVVLELARVFRPSDTLAEGRSIRFAIFDGEEDGLVGSRALLDALGSQERSSIEAAFSIEMPGARGGSQVLHAFPAPLGDHRGRLPPADLLARALASARKVGVEMSVGDPSIALIYQVLVRNLRIPFASDDASFSARGVPAFFLSDASLTRFYPHYHRPTDLPSELDRRALSAAGRAAEAILYDLQRGAPIDREASDEAIAFGSRVARGVPLWLAALLLLLPLSSTLRRARPGGVVVLGIGYSASLAASLTTALILLGPVVALSPLLLGSHSRVWKLVSVLPLIATAAAAAVAARRFDGIAVDIGFWRALALATALAGLLLIRPRNRPPRGPRDR